MPTYHVRTQAIVVVADNATLAAEMALERLDGRAHVIMRVDHANHEEPTQWMDVSRLRYKAHRRTT